MQPHQLQIEGTTQPEVFVGTVDSMVQAIQRDANAFWQDAVANDGPIEIWTMNGRRFLYNGNHRFHAAVRAGADIPDFAIVLVDRSGSTIPTFPLSQVDWLPGFK